MNPSILEWHRLTKRLAVMALDICLALIATWLAFTLRLDTPHQPQGMQWLVYAFTPTLAIAVFTSFGLYLAIFRYSGLSALAATTRAVTVYAALLTACLLWAQWPGVPRSLGALQPLIFLLLVCASRTTARLWLTEQLGHSRSPVDGHLLIYGAGAAGVQTAAAINSGRRQYILAGFIDDDPAKAGRSINGVFVFSPDQVLHTVEKLGITDILLALPSVSRTRRNEIIATLGTLPVHIRTLPGLSDLTSGRVAITDFHELGIEDLLGRKPVAPDFALLASTLRNKVVLVTGAGGSIGSELCRQIVLETPAQLLMVDHHEFSLYSIHSDLRAICSEKNLTVLLTPLLGSVRNYDRITEIFGCYQPDTVYHAAAYKHVPLVEDNPAEGIANNVLGTLHVARAALQSKTERFVLVSTDKAVRPTSIMGASKRMAELILQALANSSPPPHTCFSMVRFGNVLDSSGSVVPIFRKQLAAGGPLTVTHEEVTRYFMTIPEAAQLVLQAGAMAHGGEVFVLDMGSPVKILDLAKRMITLSGMTLRDQNHPTGDVEIQITGLRPGEKLYEELLIGNNPTPTAHPLIMKAHEEFIAWEELSVMLQALQTAIQRSDSTAIQALLSQAVPGYVQTLNTATAEH